MIFRTTAKGFYLENGPTIVRISTVYLILVKAKFASVFLRDAKKLGKSSKYKIYIVPKFFSHFTKL